MADFFPNTKMAFWAMRLGQQDDLQDVTFMYRNFISSIKIEYEINKLTKCIISINSKSALIEFFGTGKSVEIDFGYSPQSMVKMFSGKLSTKPQGQASDKITYIITAAGKALNLAREQKQRNFRGLNKPQVIARIVSENGFKPIIDISDKNKIPEQYIPMQRNKTDLEFLMELSERWNCVMWFDDQLGIIYFTDDTKAHDKGNEIKEKKRSVTDLKSDYFLGYRTSGIQNNVANLKWIFKQGQGISTGVIKSVVGVDEDGNEIESPEDQRFVEIDDVRYILRPEFVDKFGRFQYSKAVFKQALTTDNAELDDELLKKYFVALPKDSPTDKGGPGGSHAPSYSSKKLEINVSLNKGDPNLRPPRKAYLKSGSINPKADTSDLPGFLLDGGLPRIYHINKVSTELSNGAMSTSLVATR